MHMHAQLQADPSSS
jgi:chaperonin GroES